MTLDLRDWMQITKNSPFTLEVDDFGELRTLTYHDTEVIKGGQKQGERTLFPIIGNPGSQNMVTWHGSRMKMGCDGLSHLLDSAKINHDPDAITVSHSYKGQDIPNPERDEHRPDVVDYFPCDLMKVYSSSEEGMDASIGITNRHFKPIPYALGWEFPLIQSEGGQIKTPSGTNHSLDSIIAATQRSPAYGLELPDTSEIRYETPSGGVSISSTMNHFLLRADDQGSRIRIVPALHLPTPEQAYFEGVPEKQYSTLLPNETHTYHVRFFDFDF